MEDNRMKVLVFDTETTGLPTERNASIAATEKWPHIIQISFLLYETDSCRVLSCQDHIVKLDPTTPISEESSKVHGITRSLCTRKGIPIAAAIDDFNAALQSADCVVAHNLLFDKRMVMVESIRLRWRQHFTRNGKGKKEYCTMKNAVELCAIETTNASGEKYLKYPNLTELHQKLFNVAPKGTHDSMADVLICLRCYGMMRHNHDIAKHGCPMLKNLYRLYCV